MYWITRDYSRLLHQIMRIIKIYFPSVLSFVVIIFCFGKVVSNNPIIKGEDIGREHPSSTSSLPLCPLRSFKYLITRNATANAQLNQQNGGWEIEHTLPDLNGPCTVEKLFHRISQKEFLQRFAYTKPVIFVNVVDQSLFRFACTREQLLLHYGQDTITVTTANAYSYPKVKMTLRHYVEAIMKPQALETLGNETLYHFGDNDREAWGELFSMYSQPPYKLPGLESVLSFGLAGPGTGVPFHIHGPTFAETIYGRKRWLLYPPGEKPKYDPNVSSLRWVLDTYPLLSPNERPPMECVLLPGEILYFPDRWWHATVNIDASVFMSTFLA